MPSPASSSSLLASSSSSRSSLANPFAAARTTTRLVDLSPGRSTQHAASGSKPTAVAGVKRANPFDQPDSSKTPAASATGKVREQSTFLRYVGSSGQRRSASPDKPNGSSSGSSSAPGGASHKQLLRDLVSSKENSLTTRSLAAAPIDIVVTATTGHQVANYGPGRNRVDNYFAERNRKLKGQAAAKVDDIFRGVTVWFDGLVSDGSGPGALSDLELKRLVNLHGGAVANAPGQRVTHIVCATALTAKKTAALLGKTRGWRPAVVRPGWVTESVRLGKRAAVGSWSILQASEGQSTLATIFGRPASFALSKPSTSSATATSSVSARATALPAPSQPPASASASRPKKTTTSPPVVLILDSDDEDA